MPDSVVWKAKQVVHDNNYSHCLYTPFKGILRFMINAGDALLFYWMMGKILEDAYHTQCCECGDTDRTSMNYLHINNKDYCQRCATRLGILRWDGKQYILSEVKTT